MNPERVLTSVGMGMMALFAKGPIAGMALAFTICEESDDMAAMDELLECVVARQPVLDLIGQREEFLNKRGLEVGVTGRLITDVIPNTDAMHDGIQECLSYFAQLEDTIEVEMDGPMPNLSVYGDRISNNS